MAPVCCLDIVLHLVLLLGHQTPSRKTFASWTTRNHFFKILNKTAHFNNLIFFLFYCTIDVLRIKKSAGLILMRATPEVHQSNQSIRNLERLESFLDELHN